MARDDAASERSVKLADQPPVSFTHLYLETSRMRSDLSSTGASSPVDRVLNEAASPPPPTTTLFVALSEQLNKPMTVTSTGSEILVSELRNHGVSWIATLSGNGLRPFYMACQESAVPLIDTHNEQSAAYIAEAYAKLTGNLGVCAVSSGVAHSNALTGVANAYFDGTPMMLITGASEGYGSGRGVFQEFDQEGLAEPICKFSDAVTDVENVRFKVREAIARAESERPGPVHLTIPEGVLNAECVPSSTEPSGTGETPKHSPPANTLDTAVTALADAERPLLIAGNGVFYSGGQEALARFSEVADVPMVVPIWDRGCVESLHENFVGVIGAASGGPSLLPEADLVMVVGARVDYRIGFLRPPAVREDVSVIRVDSDPDALKQGRQPDISLFGSPDVVLTELTEKAAEREVSHGTWARTARQEWEQFRQPWLERDPSDESPLTGLDVVTALEPVLHDDLLFLIDGGNIGQWAHQLLGDRYPSRWLTCGVSGGVGWGLPGAMGAKLAYPEKDVLLLSGDGSFGFTPAELESAVRQELPFVAVVANDSAWGSVYSNQRDQYGERGVIASELGPISYDEVAEGFGANGRRAERRSEIAEAVEAGFSAETPTVVDVPVSVAAPRDLRE